MSIALPDNTIRSPLAAQDYAGEQKLRRDIQRIFSKPEYLPEVFLSFMIDYQAVNGSAIPFSSISGLPVPTIARETSQVTTTSLTYESLGGPLLQDLGSGNFIFIYGAQLDQSGAATTAETLMSISIDGATASDDDAISIIGDPTFTPPNGVGFWAGAVSEGTAELMYRSSDVTQTGIFKKRALLAWRTGNL